MGEPSRLVRVSRTLTFLEQDAELRVDVLDEDVDRHAGRREPGLVPLPLRLHGTGDLRDRPDEHPIRESDQLSKGPRHDGQRPTARRPAESEQPDNNGRTDAMPYALPHEEPTLQRGIPLDRAREDGS